MEFIPKNSFVTCTKIEALSKKFENQDPKPPNIPAPKEDTRPPNTPAPEEEPDVIDDPMPKETKKVAPKRNKRKTKKDSTKEFLRMLNDKLDNQNKDMQVIRKSVENLEDKIKTKVELTKKIAEANKDGIVDIVVELTELNEKIDANEDTLKSVQEEMVSLKTHNLANLKEFEANLMKKVTLNILQTLNLKEP